MVLILEPPAVQVSELHRCAAPYGECMLVAWFPAGGARSLLPR